MRFSRNFTDDLRQLDWMSNQPLAIVRFADGERAILENQPIAAADGWTQPTPGFRLALQAALLYGAKAVSDCYHVGISCPCCDAESHEFYLQQFPDRLNDRLTYSNLFANGNFEQFLKMCNACPARSVLWVGPYPEGGSLPAFLRPAFWLPRRLVNHRRWSNVIDRAVDTILNEADDAPIFVAGGPAGKILIHRLWQSFSYDCDRPCVLDIGSSLDPFIFGRPTRGYHVPGHANRTRVCTWST